MCHLHKYIYTQYIYFLLYYHFIISFFSNKKHRLHNNTIPKTFCAHSVFEFSITDTGTPSIYYSWHQLINAFYNWQHWHPQPPPPPPPPTLSSPLPRLFLLKASSKIFRKDGCRPIHILHTVTWHGAQIYRQKERKREETRRETSACIHNSIEFQTFYPKKKKYRYESMTKKLFISTKWHFL